MSDLPHVTAILSRVGLGPDLSGIAESVLEVARARGTAVHAAIEALTYGYLDREAMDETLNGYVAAYERFLADTGYKPIVAEVEVISAKWEYVGHADGVGWIGQDRVLVDWKATAALDTRSVSYQLAVYGIAWREMHPDQPVKKLLAIQLGPKGVYRLHEISNSQAAGQVFLAALIVYRARQNGRVA